ncbi:glycerol-3-phosphate responsive antiterminator [Macrococcoides caseolyticum]|uniref:glycerol-3-phosphate responsive antiterminator n=1 Tax=Macrococcoides caseolyticum TaxID=69966 RepID=UPI001F4855EA|nr:glycerol-3-phosphate responsive antiterminator [Macrococcus caseolyticus]MCE4957202.1 glycerol-3-phosphate responsive antiterminator [Macrococcus caseolyticus]
MILPAIRTMKDLEDFLSLNYKYCVILDMHISQIEHILDMLNKHQKAAYFHVDLIKGLAVDEAAVEFLIQKYKVYGIVSTKPKLIKRAKSIGAKSILRTFIIDSSALKKSYRFIEACEPDSVEVLPGIALKVIQQMSKLEQVSIIAGGLIENISEVESAVMHGAAHVTTSNKALWTHFDPVK